MPEKRSVAAAGAILWFPLAVFIGHLVLWRVLSAYDRFPHLDQPVHALGGIAIAYSAWVGIDKLVGSGVLAPVRFALRVILVFTLTSTAAVLWEFAEFVSDHTLGTHMQLGLNDTLLDMLLGMTGALAYVGWKGLRPPEGRGRDRSASPK